MPGFKDFTDGVYLTADEVDSFLMRQTVMQFPTAALRDASLVPGVVQDGMVAFTGDTDTFYTRVGGAWVPGMGLSTTLHTRSIAGTANFVKPTGPVARGHLVRIWGAGGAGGGTIGGASGTSEGGGGGGGGLVEKWYADSELAASEPYTVGAAGTGVSGGDGTNGGNTTFKGLTAGGGGGGQTMTSNATSQGALRGDGGTATGGDLNSRGDDGGIGRTILGVAIFSNGGGSSPGGGGTRLQLDFAAGVGNAGLGPGGGGTGSFSSTASFAGGQGADGKILIVSFY